MSGLFLLLSGVLAAVAVYDYMHPEERIYERIFIRQSIAEATNRK